MVGEDERGEICGEPSNKERAVSFTLASSLTEVLAREECIINDHE